MGNAPRSSSQSHTVQDSVIYSRLNDGMDFCQPSSPRCWSFLRLRIQLGHHTLSQPLASLVVSERLETGQPAPSLPAPSLSTQSLPTQGGTLDNFKRSDSTQELIPCNGSGQRVDPRVDALEKLIIQARKLKICYEYHLRGECTWVPPPCPNVHLKTSLKIQQLNALQFLAREIPCDSGNACQDWTCCFGHRCPFGGRCNKGKRCRFSREMHVTDLKVVRQVQDANKSAKQ